MKKIPMAAEGLAHLTLYDRFLCFSALAIALLGVLMVTSASIMISEQHFGYPFHYAVRQLLSLLLGFVFVGVTLKIPVAFWSRIGGMLLLFSFLLLILVLIPNVGYIVNGARRWIALGPLRLQPAELVKLWTIIYLSGYLVRHQQSVRKTFIGFFKPMFIVFLLTGLLLLQPDFGSAVVIMTTTIGMLFLAECRLLPLMVMLAGALSAGAMLVLTSPYRLRRLTAFMDPWLDQFDSGYQLTQSLIAFGRGGFLGQGLGESVQKLLYLPEAHTDFLFAVLAEELGLLGTLVVIGLFVVLIYRGFLVGKRCLQCQFNFGAYLSFGITLWLACQTMINIGVNTGLLPTKGLTLPLMSYGGASLIVAMVAIALLIRIDFEARRVLLGLASPHSLHPPLQRTAFK